MIHILLSTDKNYIMPSAVMMKSVSINNAHEEITFHILIDESVKDEQKLQLKNVLVYPQHRIDFHIIKGNIFAGFPQIGKTKKYITQATYYRLIITDLLPNNVHKIIYMDGDIIVRHSLSELYKTDLSGKAIGAVTDMAENRHDYHRLGYDKSYGYFNAGVLLINLDYWREYDLKKVYFNLIANEPEKILLHDQDVLNITLYNKKICLPLTYNFQNGFMRKPKFSSLGNYYHIYEKEIKQTIIDPTIIHYTDHIKPWHIEINHPYGFEFIKYYKQTEWRMKPLAHCNDSKIRYYISAFLRKIHLLEKKTYDKRYYSLEEIEALKTI